MRDFFKQEPFLYFTVFLSRSRSSVNAVHEPSLFLFLFEFFLSSDNRWWLIFDCRSLFYLKQNFFFFMIIHGKHHFIQISSKPNISMMKHTRESSIGERIFHRWLKLTYQVSQSFNRHLCRKILFSCARSLFLSLLLIQIINWKVRVAHTHAIYELLPFK